MPNLACAPKAAPPDARLMLQYGDDGNNGDKADDRDNAGFVVCALAATMNSTKQPNDGGFGSIPDALFRAVSASKPADMTLRTSQAH